MFCTVVFQVPLIARTLLIGATTHTVYKNVFKKGEELKINVVNSTEDERKIYEEFQNLEAKVNKIITPLKSITTSRKEGNTKHNRYTDIGIYI